MTDEMSEVARRIEYWREVRGLSQAALSQKAGLAASGINDIIKNPDRSPRLATVEAIAEALNLTLAQLLAPPGNSESVNTDPPGIAILDQAQFSAGERALYLEVCGRERVDPAVANLAEIRGPSAVSLGFMPGNVALIVPSAATDGRVVVALDEAGTAPRHHLAYCAAPWIIGFRKTGEPYHEFQQRPGLRILGVAIPVRMGTFGRSSGKNNQSAGR